MYATFPDRKTAGQRLVSRLAPYRGADAVVLGLPRGGVPVAAEVAAALGLPLDIMLVRKVGFPGQPELAIAAIAGPEGEALVVNADLARSAGISDVEIDELSAPQRQELARRRALWLGDRNPAPLSGKTVILIDDGLATGATMRAAIKAARAQHPTKVVVAVPVGARDTVREISAIVDDLVCLSQPEPFIAVGGHYDAFPQVQDDEVKALLTAATARMRAAQP